MSASRQKGSSKHYKSDHTQTSQNTTILYYHESKKISFDDVIPQDDEETIATSQSNLDAGFAHPEVEIKPKQDDKDSKKKQDIKDYVRTVLKLFS